MLLHEFDPIGCGITLHYAYETDTVLTVESLASEENGMGVRFTPVRLPALIRKEFTSQLGERWWDSPCCFVREDGSGEAFGYVETARERWNNRLRVTNLWVRPAARRQGIGGALLARALEQGRELGVRAVVLETQNCNYPAICFYRSRGFSFCGCDLTAYANDGGADGEVRIELAHLL